ncbi:hypothetical protein ZWY2020_051163 [Hordeum vulgare]|nr:hypothetical protein ZWY2020_051163 [Hordeum vulgare]
MDECLRRTLANGRRTDDLITEFNDPLNLRHNNNVRKYEERRNQDDEDFSIEVGEEEGTKSNHQSAKAKKNLQCLTMTDGGEDDRWLDDKVVDAVIEIMVHGHPKDTRDGQLVYIERVVGVAMLERDGFRTYE